jgi:thiol-disulfide isomerase/thioredoxin
MKSFIIILMFGMVLLLTSCAENTIEAPKEQPPAEAEAEKETEAEIIFSSDYFLFPHDFTAIDLYGNTVTAESLGEKRAFFVHLWATWCGPCVRGMPDLAEISRDFANDVGFIGLLLDFDSNADGAVNIIEAAGVPDSFFMIDANEPSAAFLLEIVRTGFVPSSAIITSDNHTPGPLTDRNYTQHINEALS